MSNNKTGRTRTKNSSLPSKNISSFPAVADSGPLILSTHSSEGDKDTNVFAGQRCMSYSTGSRSFSLSVTQYNIMNRVYKVVIGMQETFEEKASTALTVTVALHQANGASYVMNSKFSGAIEVAQSKLSYPPVSHRDFVVYTFSDEPDLRSVFSLEQKTNSRFVEKITVTHCFPIGEDEFYHLAIKMVVSNRSAGLLVEVEGPERRIRYSMEQRLLKFIVKASSEVSKEGVNGLFNGSTNENMRPDQALGSYVNTGTQSLTGLINSSGSLTGHGNNSIFNILSIFNRNGKERARESSSRT